MLKTLKSSLGVLYSLLRGEAPDTASAFEILYKLKKDPWNYENSSYESAKYKDTIKILAGKKYRRALEIGCAEGIFTEKLACHAEEICAVDISPTALSRAEKRLSNRENLTLICMDIEKDFPPGTFDLIICSEILYYLDDVNRIEKISRRFHQMLEPEGHLLLVHMRRKSDDECGFPPPPTGYPAMGAKTVHGIFRKSEQYKLTEEIKRPLYVASIFQRL